MSFFLKLEFTQVKTQPLIYYTVVLTIFFLPMMLPFFFEEFRPIFLWNVSHSRTSNNFDMPFDNLESLKKQPKNLVQYISKVIVAKMVNAFIIQKPREIQIRRNNFGRKYNSIQRSQFFQVFWFLNILKSKERELISLTGHHSSVNVFSKWLGMPLCSLLEKLWLKKTELSVQQCGWRSVGQGMSPFFPHVQIHLCFLLEET